MCFLLIVFCTSHHSQVCPRVKSQNLGRFHPKVGAWLEHVSCTTIFWWLLDILRASQIWDYRVRLVTKLWSFPPAGPITHRFPPIWGCAPGDREKESSENYVEKPFSFSLRPPELTTVLYYFDLKRYVMFNIWNKHGSQYNKTQGRASPMDEILWMNQILSFYHTAEFIVCQSRAHFYSI